MTFAALWALTRWRPRLAALGALAAMAAMAAMATPAPGQTLSEAQLRARFLVNFLRFTEWPEAAPPAAGTPLQLCVLGGDDALAHALDELHGTSANGHRIEVHARVGADQAAACHLLYVPDSELRRVAGARDAIGRRPVVIVGESDAVFDRGGMIALRSVDRHLSFAVNLGPAKRADLRFSPQMMHAAAEVLP